MVVFPEKDWVVYNKVTMYQFYWAFYDIGEIS